MCPHCRQDAPLVYRGVASYCAACGRPRMPLSGTALQMAGQPSKVGGSVARVVGWIILAVGLLVALLLGALFQAILPAGIFGYLLGGVIGTISVAIGLMFVYGGKSLHASGTQKERSTRQQALFALAQNRGGMLTAVDVAQALSVTPVEADTFMTQLAKEDPDRVRLEVDENGSIFYLFPHHAGAGLRVGPGPVRVGAPPAPVEEEAYQEAQKVNRRPGSP
jgi:hypothetical protein